MGCSCARVRVKERPEIKDYRREGLICYNWQQFNLTSGKIEYTFIDFWAMKCGIAIPNPEFFQNQKNLIYFAKFRL